MLTITCHQAV